MSRTACRRRLFDHPGSRQLLQAAPCCGRSVVDAPGCIQALTGTGDESAPTALHRAVDRNLIGSPHKTSEAFPISKSIGRHLSDNAVVSRFWPGRSFFPRGHGIARSHLYTGFHPVTPIFTTPGKPGAFDYATSHETAGSLGDVAQFPLSPASILRKTVFFQKPPGGWRLQGGFPSQSAVLFSLGGQPQATCLGYDG